MGIHKINYMPDEEITKNLRRMFNCRHLSEEDYELVNCNSFVRSCEETARGRLGYATFERHRSELLTDDMSAIQKVVFRATLEGIEIKNDAIFEEFIHDSSKDKFIKNLVVAFTVTCLEAGYAFGAKQLMHAYERYNPLSSNGLYATDILKYIHAAYKDLFDRKWKDLPMLCQF